MYKSQGTQFNEWVKNNSEGNPIVSVEYAGWSEVVVRFEDESWASLEFMYDESMRMIEEEFDNSDMSALRDAQRKLKG